MPVTDSKPTSDNPQTQAFQNVQYAASYPQQFEDDTIDLYELWNTLWNKKWLVIAVTAIAALGSGVYALQQPFVYKAEALLLPPKIEDLQSLNFPGVPVNQMVEPSEGLKGEYGIGVNAVFDQFKKNLSSRSMQKKFIEKQGLMDILAPKRTLETRDIEIFESFSTMIKKENETQEKLSVSMESGDSEFAAKLINDYISFFDLETVRALVSAAQNSIGSQIRNIEYKIASKREMAKVRREDEIREIEFSISNKRNLAKQQREDEIKDIQSTISSKRQMAKQRREDLILRYEVAAVIASKLRIKDMVNTIKEVDNNQLNIYTVSNPLYNRGFKALQEEIKFLKNRKSDDPFIDGLRDLQEKHALLRSRNSDDSFIFGLRGLQVQLAQLRSKKSKDNFIVGIRNLQEELVMLNSIIIEEEKIHSVTVDQAAYPPKNPIKPDRRMIVSLGTIVGLLLGIFLVFFVSFVQKQKETHSE